jgi:hypothetical protein
MSKLSCLENGNWVEHSFPPVFAQEAVKGGVRIVAGVPGGDPLVFHSLVSALEPPCFLLYVLHTSRGEGKPGRYESPDLRNEQILAFIERFGSYMRSDSRFDIWAVSTTDESKIVWDRHNRLFAYGPLDRFASELRAIGFHSGATQIPSPHSHNYRAQFDAHAAALLAAFNWSYSTLRPEDEQ